MEKKPEIINLAAKRAEREAKKAEAEELAEVYQYECAECACGFFRMYDDGTVECADCGEYNPDVAVFEPE